jgi:hypothetical protein
MARGIQEIGLQLDKDSGYNSVDKAVDSWTKIVEIILWTKLWTAGQR